MMQNFPVAAASGSFRENKLLHLHFLKNTFVKSNSEADSQTHYVCQYCRVFLKQKQHAMYLDVSSTV